MITKIARSYFNLTLATKTGDSEYSVSVRKALAFAIFVKGKVACSVLRNWSIRDLSKLTGCSQATCRKRLATLRSLHLVRTDGRNLVFKHLYKSKVENKHQKGVFHTPKQSNIKLECMDYTSCKTIERGLEALTIVNNTQHKLYYRHLIGLSRNPRPGVSLQAYKRAKRLCRKKGLTGKFVDGSLSFDGIARMVGCSKSKALEIVKYAEERKMVVRQRQELQLYLYSPMFPAKMALKYIDADKPLFATEHNIYYQPANTYLLGAGIIQGESYRQLLYHNKKVCA